MPGRTRPAAIRELARWIVTELHSRGSIFGIDRSLFVSPAEIADLETMRYGGRLAAPVGIAAGPHTQLAQNIVAGWLCGARFIELKTVQARDHIEVAKPCIDMEDEGYNCEWSQELTLEESYDQYLSAWLLIHLLHRELFGTSPGARSRREGSARAFGPGVLFNMSVGYDLAGIESPGMRRFVARMRDSGEEIARRLELLSALFPEASGIEVPAQVSGSVTLSTMHGCPPEEVERIGRHLIEEAGLHTAVKLNPTLLGPQAVREILNERLGYRSEVPDAAFAHDLVYEDALRIIASLKAAAARRGLSFTVKLSNTLECLNTAKRLPAGERTIYLSGRALYPLTTALAARLAGDFDGELDISYAGGADAHSFPALVAAGVWPVTVCSDLLRPGGYGRLGQYLSELGRAMAEAGAGSVDELAEKGMPAGGASPKRLEELAAAALHGGRFDKSYYASRSIKNTRELTDFDCIAAPCVAACPVGQQIPRYLHAAALGEADEALRIVREDNPAASLCAMVCDHPCELACTRLNYDEPLAIRDVKRWAVERGSEPPLPAGEGGGPSVGIVGAGPAGLACAYELARAGASVTLYEAAGSAGGMAARAIPRYRLDEGDLLRDVARVEAAGARLLTGRRLSAGEAREIIEGEHDFLYYAGGAPLDARLGVPGEDSPLVTGALAFLDELKATGRFRALASRDEHRPAEILVVGGGNSAMDAARSALRLTGPLGGVRLLYRRTVAQMPADREELEALRSEGAKIEELTQPVAIEERDGVLVVSCIRTRLGECDDSGRPRPLPVEGATFSLEADLLITAVGQRPDEAAIALGCSPGPVGRSPSSAGGRVGAAAANARILTGGDALRGPASVVLAAADGKAAAQAILDRAPSHGGAGPVAARNGRDQRTPTGATVRDAGGSDRDGEPAGWALRASRLAARRRPPLLPLEKRDLTARVIGTLSDEEAAAEASRCLECDLRCDVCVGVCPNRAMISYSSAPRRYPLHRFSGEGADARFERSGELAIQQERQVLNIAELCNECGNCATFCPSSGAPFRQKPRICLTEEGFAEEASAYFLPAPPAASILHRGTQGISRLDLDGDRIVWTTPRWRASLSAETMVPIEITGSGEKEPAGSTEEAVRMALLLFALRESPFRAAAATPGEKP